MNGENGGSVFPVLQATMNVTEVVDAILTDLGYSVEEIRKSETLARVKLLDRDALCYVFYWVEMWLYMRHEKEVWFPARDIDVLFEKGSYLMLRASLTYRILLRYIKKKVSQCEHTLIR